MWLQEASAYIRSGLLGIKCQTRCNGPNLQCQLDGQETHALVSQTLLRILSLSGFPRCGPLPHNPNP